MKELETKAVSAGFNSALAAQRARMYHETHKGLHTTQNLRRAEAMRGVLDSCYYNNDVFVTARAKTISIKVSGTQVKDAGLLKMAETMWETDGITKKSTAQGYIYHIPL